MPNLDPKPLVTLHLTRLMFLPMKLHLHLLPKLAFSTPPPPPQPHVPHVVKYIICHKYEEDGFLRLLHRCLNLFNLSIPPSTTCLPENKVPSGWGSLQG